jgi:HD domain
MSQPPPTDPIGSIRWTERTGGVLTTRECLTLARPLLRAELSILAGRLAIVLRMHSGRRSSIDPASLVPPDSSLARDAKVVAQDLLTPVLLNHSSRAYTWGAAIAALHGITFDRELLYLAAMFHDTGIPSPVPDVDFTVRSASLAREFTDSHYLPADIRELVANAIAMHYTPVRRRSRRCVRPPQQRDTQCSPPERHPGLPAVGLQAGVRRASPSRGQASPSRPRLVPAPLRHKRPKRSTRALPWLM